MKATVLLAVAATAAIGASLAQHVLIQPEEQVRVDAVHRQPKSLSAGKFMNASVSDQLSAQMVDYGLYRVSRFGRKIDGQVAGGLVQSLGAELILTTETVPATLGTSFGFRYKLSGPGSEADVRIRVLHPQPLNDPAAGRGLTYSEWSQSVPVGQVNWNTGWLFEHSWELVPGPWTMQLYSGETLLLEKRFEVVKPMSTP